MKDITITLKNSIEYDLNGKKEDGSFVTLFAPTTKHIHLTSILKQAFQISAMKMNEKNKGKEIEDKEDKEEDDELTSSDAITIIYSGGNAINIKEVVLTAKELLTSGLVKVEGEIKLTKPLCDKLSQEDFEEILGSFLVNFIVASLLRNQKNK